MAPSNPHVKRTTTSHKNRGRRPIFTHRTFINPTLLRHGAVPATTTAKSKNRGRRTNDSDGAGALLPNANANPQPREPPNSEASHQPQETVLVLVPAWALELLRECRAAQRRWQRRRTAHDAAVVWLTIATVSAAVFYGHAYTAAAADALPCLPRLLSNNNNECAVSNVYQQWLLYLSTVLLPLVTVRAVGKRQAFLANNRGNRFAPLTARVESETVRFRARVPPYKKERQPPGAIHRLLRDRLKEIVVDGAETTDDCETITVAARWLNLKPDFWNSATVEEEARAQQQLESSKTSMQQQPNAKQKSSNNTSPTSATAFEFDDEYSPSLQAYHQLPFLAPQPATTTTTTRYDAAAIDLEAPPPPPPPTNDNDDAPPQQQGESTPLLLPSSSAATSSSGGATAGATAVDNKDDDDGRSPLCRPADYTARRLDPLAASQRALADSLSLRRARLHFAAAILTALGGALAVIGRQWIAPVALAAAAGLGQVLEFTETAPRAQRAAAAARELRQIQQEWQQQQHQQSPSAATARMNQKDKTDPAWQQWKRLVLETEAAAIKAATA